MKNTKTSYLTKKNKAESEFITYPARPTTGCAVDSTLWRQTEDMVRVANMVYSPKYNGWRVLLHVPTGMCFNRKLKPLSIEDEFRSAIEYAQGRAKEIEGVLTGFDWLDCEGLERRHNIGRGTLIVLDAPQLSSTAEDRYTALCMMYTRLSIHEKPENGRVYVTPHFPLDAVSVIFTPSFAVTDFTPSTSLNVAVFTATLAFVSPVVGVVLTTDGLDIVSPLRSHGPKSTHICSVSSTCITIFVADTALISPQPLQ